MAAALTGFTAQQFADGSPLVFKHGNATDVIVRPDGTVVQPGVTGQIGVTSGGTSGGSSSSPSPSGNNDGVECNGSIKLNDGGGGFVNNPHSSRKSMKINFPANLTGNIRKARVYSDGKVFDTLYFGGYEYGGRERHYGTKSIGSYPDNVLLQTELTSGRYLCVTIPDPQRRYD